MARFAFVLLLFVFHGSSFAGVYKCMHADGKIEYQAAPCATGQELPVKTPMPSTQEIKLSPAKSQATNPCGDKGVQIKFERLAVISMLGLLADLSGSKLQADASIVDYGAFDYQCVPLMAVLQNVALRYNLDVRVENGTIFARRR